MAPRDSRRHRANTRVAAVGLAILVTLWAVAAVTIVGGMSGLAVADDHTWDSTNDMTKEANFTIDLPFTSDHYPGDENPENASIQYWASGEDAFEAKNAEAGIWMDMIRIRAEFDYSACAAENTYGYGIDRGNNNSGTEYDENLVTHAKESQFRDDGIDSIFYDWDDYAGDPPYLAAEDAVVAEQGERSAGGGCLTMPETDGWYQIQSFINGTVADNGPDEPPSDDADEIGVRMQSTYVYVCTCDSEEEAEQELGPRPAPEEEWSSDDTDDSSDNPEATPTAADEGGSSTATGADDPSTETAANDDDDEHAPEDTDTADGSDDDGADGDVSTEPTGEDESSNGGAVNETPEADGPGFGAIAAVLALLSTAVIVMRRR